MIYSKSTQSTYHKGQITKQCLAIICNCGQLFRPVVTRQHSVAVHCFVYIYKYIYIYI